MDGELWALLSAREQQPASLHVGIIDAGPPRWCYSPSLFFSLSLLRSVCVRNTITHPARLRRLRFILSRPRTFLGLLAASFREEAEDGEAVRFVYPYTPPFPTYVIF